MTPQQLKSAINKLPQKSGIYLFKQGSKILYVGKALNLKNRIGYYLKPINTRLQEIVSRAKRIDFIETGSDIEALTLESQLIKKLQPKFNIMLRDDKQFFFVGFSNEDFPKIFITHQPDQLKALSLKPKAKFVGPFTDGTALKTTLRYLRQIFPYCTCKKPHNNFCLNYHIGKCPGFCCLKSTNTSNRFLKLSYDNFKKRQDTRIFQKEYRKNIKAVKDILSGKKTSLLKRLEKEMIKHGREEKFQEAIELRKKIEKIKRVFENAKIVRNISYSHISLYGSGRGNVPCAKKILGLKQPPRRIEGYDIANIQGKYAVGAMVVFTLQQSSGQANYKPDKNEYRKFKIRGVGNDGDVRNVGIDKNNNSNKRSDQTFRTVRTTQTSVDTGMLKEMLETRFKHMEWPFPDLIIIDGGKAQLSATLKVISNFKFLISKQIPIIALTKDEKHRGSKIYVSNKKTAIALSRLPISVKNLLLHIDAEAHRFAIGYYRKLHRKKILFT